MAAVVAAIGFQGSAIAQTPWDDLTEPTEYLSIGVGDSGWTLYPIISADDVFIGFFGYLPSELVVGDNVSLLWLVPDSGDGTWSMYGWLNDDLKTASDYLDNLSGRQQVLADTGLDILFQDDQPLVEPISMPFGIIEDDPASAIVEASQDPDIADILVTVGAGGAPSLTKATNAQPLDCAPAISGDGGGNISELDMKLAFAARGIQDMMIVWLSEDILDSIDATGYGQDTEWFCCWPTTYTIYGTWSPWSCTGGPSQYSGQCRWTGCTRSRLNTVVNVTFNCTAGTYSVMERQGPQSVTIIVPGGTECPPSP